MGPEKRKRARIEWLSPGAIYLTGGSGPIPCVVSNLSSGGAKIARVEAKSLPNEFTLDVWPSNRCTRRCIIVWRGHSEVGVQFAEPLLTSKALTERAGKLEEPLQGVRVAPTGAVPEPAYRFSVLS